jgi:hypothetical protein
LTRIPSAANCCVAPLTIVGPGGVTVIDATWDVSRVDVPATPENVALIVVAPGVVPAVARPVAASIMATL